MFFTIQANEYTKFPQLIDQMFRLRKRVFADQLKWDVPVRGEFERDAYDALDPVYLVWTNPERTILYGAMRLMPTTGPTLLYDVFGNTFPDEAGLMAPGIWEGTRACIDTEAIKVDHPDISPTRAFSLLILATFECALAHGIHTIVSNYEPQMKRIYRRAGAEFVEHGRAHEYGRLPVCCGTIEVSNESHKRMQDTLGLSFPLYAKPRPKIAISDALQEMAA